MKQSKSIVLVLLCLCGCTQPVEEIRPDAVPAINETALTVAPSDWPWWWGPHRNGTTIEQDVPTVWTTSENVVWSSPVPGRGHSSPCVFGQRLFLTTADADAEQQQITCFNRGTGEQLWARIAHQGQFMKSHRKNSHASATAACDGERVFGAFLHAGGLWVTATDLDGEIAWQREAGPFRSEHGYGSSPVVHGPLVIVLGDNLSGSFIAALDRGTGKIVWRTARETTGRHGSYATPMVADVAGKTQLLVTGMSGVASYDPNTGGLIWSCDGPAEVTAGTIACGDELIFASGGYPEKELLAIRADGQGDVTDTHVVWRSRKGVTYVPSPLYHDGKLFVVNDDGIATCFQAETGETLGTKRLGGNFSASPILAGGHLYVPNEAGVTYVVKADPTLEIVSRNDLSDGGFASLSICNRQIFLRTNHKLYCIASTDERVSSKQKRSVRQGDLLR